MTLTYYHSYTYLWSLTIQGVTVCFDVKPTKKQLRKAKQRIYKHIKEVTNG